MGLPSGGASSPKSASSSSNLLLAWGLPLILGFAGAYITFKVKAPVQLPGHTGLVQMLAILIGYAAASGNRAAGLTGGVGALLAGLTVQQEPVKSLGLVVAGGVIDGLLYLSRRWPLQVLWFTLAGGLGNGAVLVVKLLSGDLPKAVLKSGLGFAFMTYIGFGLAGGLIAGLVAHFAMRRSEN